MRLAVVALLLAGGVAHGDVGIGWAGALHAGAGGTLDGGPPRPHGVDLGIRLHLLVGRDRQGGVPDESWSTGPFVDVHTLGAGRTEVVGGVHIGTPGLRHSIGALRLDVGGGYSFGYGGNVSAPELVVSLFGGGRMAARGHLLAHAGVYVETRVFFADARAVTLSAGVELDPIGILMIVFGAAGSGGR